MKNKTIKKCNCGKPALPNEKLCEECTLELGAFAYGF